MKLKRLPEKPQPETIVALIDVIFFLLVFFMLVGRMDATAPFDMVPPLALTGADLPGGGLTIAVDDDGEYAVDGQILPVAEVLGIARRRIAAEPKLLVRVNADQGAALRFVLPLISQLEALGAAEVVLIVTPNPQ